MDRIVVTGSHRHSETRVHFEVSIDDRRPGTNRPVTPDRSSIVSTALGKLGKIGLAPNETENDR